MNWYEGLDSRFIQQYLISEGMPWFDYKDIPPYDDSAIYPVTGIVIGSAALDANKKTNGYYDGIGGKYTIIKDDYPEVAGYKTSAVNYYGVYSVKNGELVTDLCQGRFYAGQYVFDNPDDINAMFDNLNGKLTGLYGEADETKEPVETPAEDKHVFWYGAEETGVALSIKCADENGTELNQITITYFWDTFSSFSLCNMFCQLLLLTILIHFHIVKSYDVFYDA